MGHKFDPRQKDALLTDEREALLRPTELLRTLGLEAGNTMADIGCGPGFFTIPAAEIVGERGQVFAADIQGEMLSSVKARVTQHGLTNVRVVKTSDIDVPLRAESLDLALLAFTLNEIDQRARFLHRVSRLLRPSGRIAVLEWKKRDEPVGPPMAQRIAREEIRQDAEAAGLHQVEDRDLNDSHYLCVFVPTHS